MKKLAFALALFVTFPISSDVTRVISTSTSPSKPSNEKEKNALQAPFNGPVRTITLEKAVFQKEDESWKNGPRLLLNEDSYNREGKPTKSVAYNKDGIARFLTIWTYDEEGRVAEWEIRGISPTGVHEQRFAYEYDSMGNIKVLKKYENGKFKGFNKISRDDNGNHKETIKCAPDGTVTGGKIYSYDHKGNVSEEAIFDKTGTFIWRQVYSYDSEGRMIGELFYGENDVPEGKEAYAYDSHGNEIQHISYTEADEVRSIEKYKHDDVGSVIETTRYNPDGSVQSRVAYSYEYDSHGNWTKKLKSEWISRNGESDFRPVEVEYRTITYYSQESQPEQKRGPEPAEQGTGT